MLVNRQFKFISFSWVFNLSLDFNDLKSYITKIDGKFFIIKFQGMLELFGDKQIKRILLVFRGKELWIGIPAFINSWSLQK